MGIVDIFGRKKQKPENIQKTQPAPQNTAKEIPARISGKLPSGAFFVALRVDKDLYGIEIHDLTGRYIDDIMWMPGNDTVAAFYLTEDEYLLAAESDNDNVNPQFAEFAQKLLEQKPKDRLADLYYVEMSTLQKTPVRMRLTVETIDDFKFRKQKGSDTGASEDDAVSFLKAQSEIYIPYYKQTGNLFPMIDIEGYARVFTKKEYADQFIDIIKHKEDRDLLAQKYTQTDFIEEIRSWYQKGVARFWLNAGTDDHNDKINRDAFLPDPKAKEWDYLGSSLRQTAARFVQLTLVKDPKMQIMFNLFWTGVINGLYDTPLLVPVRINYKENRQDDSNTLHCTKAAAELMLKLETERITKRTGSKPQLRIEDLTTEMIPGAENYTFAKRGDAKRGMMHLSTIKNSQVGESMLCGFTDLNLIRKLFGDDYSVGLFTYEEIIAHIEETLSTGETISGFILNPSADNFVLTKEQIHNISAQRQSN